MWICVTEYSQKSLIEKKYFSRGSQCNIPSFIKTQNPIKFVSCDWQ